MTDAAGSDWSDAANDATVAAYFDLLRTQSAGRRVNKAVLYRDVAARIGRGAKAVEFKFQNISFVIETHHGHGWATGLKPLANIQRSLTEAVARWLDVNDMPRPPRRAIGMADPADLFIGPPPSLRNAPPDISERKRIEVSTILRMADRDAANRALGERGEEYIYRREVGHLRRAGRTDLAERVVWTARDQGDGAGYDIESFEPDGAPRLLEVKTTEGWMRTPFHVSANELRVAAERSEKWHLVRLYDFAKDRPQAYAIRPPLENHVELTAESFRASLH